MRPEILQTTELMASLLQAKVLTDDQAIVAQYTLGKCLQIISEQVDDLHRVLTN